MSSARDWPGIGHRSNQDAAWFICFSHIQAAPADPQDIGPAVVALPTYLPDDIRHEGRFEYQKLRRLIAELEDGDQHKKQAQTVLHTPPEEDVPF